MSTKKFRLLVEKMPTVQPSVDVFWRLFGGSDTAFFLDSNGSERWSIMGDAEGELAATLRADVTEGTVTIATSRGTRVVHSGMLDYLHQQLRTTSIVSAELPFEFRMGWIGYLGYEMGAECGQRPRYRSPYPDAQLIFPAHAVVMDEETTYLLALAEDDPSQAELWLASNKKSLSTITSQPPNPHKETPEIRQRHTDPAYLGLISRCQEAIARGESYELCLTNELSADIALPPWPTYLRLRAYAPAPMSSFLRFGELSILSSSPERFLSVDAQGKVKSSPIKGTRPRYTDPIEDEAAKTELRGSEKDRAENVMIVDLVRNDLARCARTGTVRVTELFAVKTFGAAHQLVSTVQAELAENSTAIDVVRAAFPPGSMTGAPKIRSIELLEHYERGPRGIYSGAIGYFSPNGAADLAVVIRTAVLTANRLSYGVGGAILALSDPQEELAETKVKAAPLRAMLPQPVVSSFLAGEEACHFGYNQPMSATST